MANHAVTAVDIAKSIFEIAVSIQPGRVKERVRLPRSKFMIFFATRSLTTELMEACGSSHHWSRKLEQLGHQIVLLPPSLVRPYRKRNKTDRPTPRPSSRPTETRRSTLFPSRASSNRH